MVSLFSPLSHSDIFFPIHYALKIDETLFVFLVMVDVVVVVV